MHIRFTSCALDDELQELSNSGFSTSSTVTLNRYGDLITRLALEVTLPPLAAPVITIPGVNGAPATTVTAKNAGAHYVNCIGYAIFEDVTVQIGGATIDQLFSDYAFIFEELSGRPGLRLEEAIGRVPFSSEVDEDLIEKANKKQILYVPLPLWISKYQPQTWGLALVSFFLIAPRSIRLVFRFDPTLNKFLFCFCTSTAHCGPLLPRRPCPAEHSLHCRVHSGHLQGCQQRLAAQQPQPSQCHHWHCSGQQRPQDQDHGHKRVPRHHGASGK